MKDTDIIICWLFAIIDELEEKLHSEATIGSEEQLEKLKQVVRDYNLKYKKELFTRRKFDTNLQQNQTFILACLKSIDAVKNSDDEAQNGLIVSVLGHLIFLYDTNELLRRSLESKDYEKFSSGNTVEKFLASEGKNAGKIGLQHGCLE